MPDTWDSLFAKLAVVTKDATNIIGKQTALLLRQKLWQMWYLDEPENQYDRTYDLLNSIKVLPVTKNGKYSYISKIVFDDGVLSRGLQDSSPWTQHSSMTDGGNTWIEAGALAWILDVGVNTPYHVFNGVHYVDATIKDLKSIKKDIEAKLSAMGYNVKVYF